LSVYLIKHRAFFTSALGGGE